MAQGRRLIFAGGLRMDGKQVVDPEQELEPGKHKIEIGKRFGLEIETYP